MGTFSDTLPARLRMRSTKVRLSREAKARVDQFGAAALINSTGLSMEEIGLVVERGLSDPKRPERFASLQLNHMAVIAKAAAAGLLTEAEVDASIYLAEMLDEASEGNYCNANWPEPLKRKGRPRVSFDRAKTAAILLGLLKERMVLDACEDWQAASRISFDVDDKIAATSLPDTDGQHVSLLRWASPYERARPAAGSRPRVDNGKDEHAFGPRLERWLTRPIERPGWSSGDTPGLETLEVVEQSIALMKDTPRGRDHLQRLYNRTIDHAAKMVLRSWKEPKTNAVDGDAADASTVAE